MSYDQAMEAAGAKVHCFEQFGSYQGDWWAKVTVDDKTGWVCGSYGSCSGCDAFEAEFGWRFYDLPENEKSEKLANFGQEYLETLMTQKEAEEAASKNMSWDRIECEQMLKFLSDNKI